MNIIIYGITYLNGMPLVSPSYTMLFHRDHRK